ncbi:MAG: hypothetical protein JSV65_17825 [Armatimonadota bacterium]|nr:MAG: hypothetical protein JSV65_17825 [Armatimonadota bacterium]
MPSPRKGYEPAQAGAYLPRVWVERYADVPWPAPGDDLEWDEEPRIQNATEGSPEDWVDVNGNGQYDASFEVTHAGAGDSHTAWEEYRGFVTGGAGPGAVTRLKPVRKELLTAVYVMHGPPEPYTDVNGNGQYDAGEPFDDWDENGQWDEVPLVLSTARVDECLNWADFALATAGVELWRKQVGIQGSLVLQTYDQEAWIAHSLFDGPGWWPHYAGVLFAHDQTIDNGIGHGTDHARRHEGWAFVFVTKIRDHWSQEPDVHIPVCRHVAAHELGHVVSVEHVDEDPAYDQPDWLTFTYPFSSCIMWGTAHPHRTDSGTSRGVLVDGNWVIQTVQYLANVNTRNFHVEAETTQVDF